MKPYFEHRHVVTFADTNLVGNVYFAHYLSWQGACRERFLAAHAPAVAARLTDDLALVTLSCSCDYFSELHALDVVSIRMSLRGPEHGAEFGAGHAAGPAGHAAGPGAEHGRVAMDFTYFRIGSGPAQLVARGAQTVACMRRGAAGLEPCRLPAELRDALAAYAGDAAPAAVQG